MARKIFIDVENLSPEAVFGIEELNKNEIVVFVRNSFSKRTRELLEANNIKTTNINSKMKSQNCVDEFIMMNSVQLMTQAAAKGEDLEIVCISGDKDFQKLKTYKEEFIKKGNIKVVIFPSVFDCLSSMGIEADFNNKDFENKVFMFSRLLRELSLNKLKLDKCNLFIEGLNNKQICMVKKNPYIKNIFTPQEFADISGFFIRSQTSKLNNRFLFCSKVLENSKLTSEQKEVFLSLLKQKYFLLKGRTYEEVINEKKERQKKKNKTEPPKFVNLKSPEILSLANKRVKENKKISCIEDVFKILQTRYISPNNWSFISSQYTFSIDFAKEYEKYIDWEELSRSKLTLDDKFIEAFPENFNWDYLSQFKKLPKEILINYSSLVNWEIVSKWQEIDEDLLDKYKKHLNWALVSKYQSVSEEFWDKNSNWVDWENLSKRNDLSYEFIKSHLNRLNIFYLGKNLSLPEEFIEKYQFQMNWNYISSSQRPFSDKFIDTYCEKINWELYSENKYISEYILKKYSKYLNWEKVSQNRLFNEEEIDKFSKFISFDKLIKSQQLKTKIIEKYLDRFNIDEVCIFQNVPMCFVTKHKDKINPDIVSEFVDLSESFITKNKSKLNMKLISKYQNLSSDFIENNKGILDNYYVNLYQEVS